MSNINILYPRRSCPEIETRAEVEYVRESHKVCPAKTRALVEAPRYPRRLNSGPQIRVTVENRPCCNFRHDAWPQIRAEVEGVT